jgi:hypothetical protein
VEAAVEGGGEDEELREEAGEGKKTAFLIIVSLFNCNFAA